MTTPTRLHPLAALIFASRWLQVPLYLGLIAAQGVYVFLFCKELWHLLHEATTLTEQQVMLGVLGLIDVVMISAMRILSRACALRATRTSPSGWTMSMPRS